MSQMKYYNKSIIITKLRAGNCQCDPAYTGAKTPITENNSDYFKFYLYQNQCPVCHKSNPRVEVIG